MQALLAPAPVQACAVDALLAYPQALRRILDRTPLMAAADVELEAATGRVLARAVISPASLPRFDNAALDGFALDSRGQAWAAGSEAVVAGRQVAGDSARANACDAWEIMTGALLPEGLDTVVPLEQVAVLAREDGRPARIRLLAAPRAGQHVRRCGEDVASGQAVLEAGRRLLARELMLLHALGLARVPVRRVPRVAVISTGGELQGQGGVLQPGQVHDSNLPYLCMQLRAAGAEVVWQGGSGDEVGGFQRSLDQALAQAPDLIISSGGVSMGCHDFVPAALLARGAELAVHKVRARPGKPLLFGRLGEGPLYFGLPGNPMAAAAGLRFFVEPALRAMLGLAPERALQVPLATALPRRPGLRQHLRGCVACDAHGRLSAFVLPAQEPFRLMPMLAANAWVVVEPGEEALRPGQCVDAFGFGHWQPVALEAL